MGDAPFIAAAFTVPAAADGVHALIFRYRSGVPGADVVYEAAVNGGAPQTLVFPFTAGASSNAVMAAPLRRGENRVELRAARRAGVHVLGLDIFPAGGR